MHGTLHDRRRLPAVLLLLLLCGAPLRAHAQEFVCSPIEPGDTVSRLGRRLTGSARSIYSDAFQIREDGVRREVVRVSRATEPIDIAILVDNSAAARDDVTFLRNGLSNFVAKIAPGNHVAVIALADRPTILVDYTDDTKRLTSAVGSIFAMTQSGMTLLDAIYETTRGLARRATTMLRDAGFDVVGSGNWTERLDSNVVLVRSGREDWGALAALALGGARVEARPDSSRYLDLTILVGTAWRPPPQPFDP